MGESILVTTKGDLDLLIGPVSDGFFEVDSSVLEKIGSVSFFNDRLLSEHDENLKQVIPYAAIRRGGKILSYTRGKKGSESRLHAKKSIGIGGHINPEDTDGFIFENGLKREILEEIGVNENEIKVRFLGILNEDQTEVGRVHLGYAYIVDLENSAVLDFENTLVNPEWLDLNEVDSSDEFEIWSQFFIKFLKNEQ